MQSLWLVAFFPSGTLWIVCPTPKCPGETFSKDPRWPLLLRLRKFVHFSKQGWGLQKLSHPLPLYLVLVGEDWLTDRARPNFLWPGSDNCGMFYLLLRDVYKFFTMHCSPFLIVSATISTRITTWQLNFEKSMVVNASEPNVLFSALVASCLAGS